MDEEEWPVDPDAIVVSDEPAEPEPEPAESAQPADPESALADQPPEAEAMLEPAESEAAAVEAESELQGSEAVGEPAEPEPAESELQGSEAVGEPAEPEPAPADQLPAAEAMLDGPALPRDEVASVESAPFAPGRSGESSGTSDSKPSRAGTPSPRRSALVPVTIVVLISAIFGRTLVNQRDDARDAARLANENVAAMRDEIESLRSTVAQATRRQDDPFGDVFVERQDEVRADVLDDVLADQRADLRTCVASQLTEAVAGNLPQVPLDGIEAQYAATVDWVQRVRGLQFDSVPTLRLVDRASLVDAIAPTTIDPTTRSLDNELWAALGAIEEGADTVAITDELRRAAIAGTYDPTNNELRLAVQNPTGALEPLELVALAHELEHALVVQKVGLSNSSDEQSSLAALALVEGDATLTMTRFEIGALDPIALIGSLDGQSFRVAEDRVAEAPHIVGARLLFPYTDGLAFACDLERDGGNSSLDSAYAAPPSTSAQVMWPERYRAGEAPVDLRDMPSPGDRWTELRRTSIGALELRSIFEAPGDDSGRALSDPAARASGWAGGEVGQWERGDDAAIGIALAEHPDHDGPTLCSSLMEWYQAAFPNDEIERATDGLVAIGDDRVAVIRCSNNTVRLGIGPDAETAAAITR